MTKNDISIWDGGGVGNQEAKKRKPASSQMRQDWMVTVMCVTGSANCLSFNIIPCLLVWMKPSFLAEYTAVQNKDYVSHLPLQIDMTTGNKRT